MQDNIPDALIAAFERHYDFPWNEPTLRNERLAWRAAWAEATKPCLHQIQEPAPVLAVPAAVNPSETPNSSTIAVPSGWKLVPDDATPEWVENLEALPDWRDAVGECIKKFLAASPVAPQAAPAAVAVPENVREGAPYDNPAFEKLARELGVWGTAQSAVCAQFWLAATPAAAPVVLPEPVTWLIERSAFHVSPHGQDAESNEWLEEAHEPGEEGSFPVYTEQQVRALLATGGQAQAVERGEVLVTVSGFTGSGKSAIAGEIEILCRALGLQVEWPDGDSEKNMTHADWTAALEQYKPRVHIVEQNIPFAAMKGMSK